MQNSNHFAPHWPKLFTLSASEIPGTFCSAESKKKKAETSVKQNSFSARTFPTLSNYGGWLADCLEHIQASDCNHWKVHCFQVSGSPAPRNSGNKQAIIYALVGGPLLSGV